MNSFGGVSFSAIFDRNKDSFSESLYTHSDFPCERHFLAPLGQKGGQNWPFPIKWQRKAENLYIYIYIHIYNVASEIWLGHLFLSNYIFDPFWGAIRGQRSIQTAKDRLEYTSEHT